ncbi:MAG: DUF1552 domain-containing protein, partial [Myxococcota bacterium]|nr:DUF1552 domain-containing protein [Myxococcota bacterium]
AQAADGVTPPKRFLAVFTPNGTIGDEWIPDGTESAFTFNRILEPLNPYKSKLLVLDGLDMTAVRGPGSAHQQGAGCLLTGRPLNDGSFGGGGGTTSGWASGISIDQYIANELAPDTTLRTLELGVGVVGSNNRHRIAYAGDNEPLPPQNDPWAVFDLLFGDFDAGAAELERRRRRQQSILDAVRGDVTELQGRLGREDRARLDAHLTSLRELERRLSTGGGDRGAACEPPTLGTRIDPLRAANFPTMARLQIDLAVMAFACDQTRIGTLLFSGATSGLSFPWIGITQGHHDLSHEGDSNADAKAKLVQINRWYAEQLAYLLERLESIPEGDGTMLDNTIVFWGNELSKGNNHSRNDMKFIVAGNAGGALRTGRFVRYAAVPHNNLLLTFANVMGVPATTFGAAAHCTGPLTDIT